MDVAMTIGAIDTLADMDAGVVLGTFTFMAAFALHLLHPEFFFHMAGKIGNIHMATGAAILAVNGAGKSLNGHPVAVASKARGRINSHSLLGNCGQCPAKGEDNNQGNKVQTG